VHSEAARPDIGGWGGICPRNGAVAHCPSLLTHHGSRRLPARSQDEALRARERVRRARKAERERALAAEEASLEAVGHSVLFCSVLFCSVRLSVFCYSVLSFCLSVCLSVCLSFACQPSQTDLMTL
jgi:hypothetical protein